MSRRTYDSDSDESFTINPIHVTVTPVDHSASTPKRKSRCNYCLYGFVVGTMTGFLLYYFFGNEVYRFFSSA